MVAVQEGLLRTRLQPNLTLHGTERAQVTDRQTGKGKEHE